MLTTILAALAMSSAFAKSELVAKSDFRNESYRVHAELWFDKARKRPDLWFELDQSRGPDGKVSFKATSLPERLGEVEWRLKPAPLARLDAESVVVFNGFSQKTGYYDGNRSLALVFHMPASDLGDPTVELFAKAFPGSIVLDASGKPQFAKAVLVRITESQVYPIAAFDQELTPARER